MSEKGVTFRNKQTGVSEHLSVSELQGKTFADVAEHLYTLLLKNTRIIQDVLEKRTNIVKNERRAGQIKFFYNEDGTDVPISQAKPVVDFYMDTGKGQVEFMVDVIGGYPASDSPNLAEELSNFQFLHHAQILRDKAQHGTWELKEYSPNRFRLMKTTHDRFRRSITVILQASAGYPHRPPRVITIPPHRDPCFQRGGELDWAVVADTNQFTWELYQHHDNPLVYLLDELRSKYRLVF